MGGHPTLPRRAPSLTTGQEVLGLQEIAAGDRLSQKAGGAWVSLGIRATGQLGAIPMAQVDGGVGGAWSSTSTGDTGWGLPRVHSFKRNLWVLTCFTGWLVWVLEHGPSSRLGACGLLAPACGVGTDSVWDSKHDPWSPAPMLTSFRARGGPSEAQRPLRLSFP